MNACIEILQGSRLGAIRRRGEVYRSPAVDVPLVRLRPGAYASADAWGAARPEDRVVARARALRLTAAESPVFSHETAAAIHGLPLYRPDPDRVHISLDDARPGAAHGTVRHRSQLRDDEVVEVDGLRCTSLIRTVADVARTATFERAVVVADAALRVVAGRVRQGYDEDSAADFVGECGMIAERSAHGRARGAISPLRRRPCSAARREHQSHKAA
ncbi:hypothetical protein GCM10025768_09390 [Microbacterium pseudoresistens]|uniref:AbiEi antitoxin C-terminal domain-containing protein n=1 Tax=Microbacterium pseudoresistens TaxID=640634 RepID=A0A7Y9EVQ3_9MICO|nr:hypothetical protein [Microbacterium pseudoresistens]NYD54842.1 hypothetical protein [Microbacterium pseudoresistens]